MRRASRGWVLEGFLLSIGAAATLTLAFRNSSLFWAIVGGVLALGAAVCLIGSLCNRLANAADRRRSDH